MSRFWAASGNALKPSSFALPTAAAAWTPNSEATLAFAYDMLDASKVYKDNGSGGFTVVTADGDRINKIDDLNANANPVLQATSGQRPAYKPNGTQHYGFYDGSARADYMETAAGLTITNGTGEFVVGTTFYREAAASGNQSPIDGDQASGGTRIFQLRDASGTINFIPNPGAGVSFGTGTLATNTFYTIIALLDKTSNIAEIYINGVLDSSAAFSGAAATGTTKVAIGGRVGGSQQIYGRVARGAIFKKGKDATLIANLHTWLSGAF